MATDGAGGEQPAQIQALTPAVRGRIEMKCEFNMDNLSKPELLTLLSIMEGELEARDLVIEALRARRNESFTQERYGRFSLADPFLALQRDFDAGGGAKARRPVCASPVSVLEVVMAHCKKMQERMSAQLAAAELRQKKLEQEKTELQSLQLEQRKLSAQLKDEREKGKHVVAMLVRDCKQLASRLEEEGRASGRLGAELRAERQKGQQMEAEMEKQLWELDTEREQLRARLGREEARAEELRRESEGLRKELEELRARREAPPPAEMAPPPAGEATPTENKATPPTVVSVAVGTERPICRAAACQTDPVPAEAAPDGPRKAPVILPAKPSPAHYAGMSLPKSGAGARGPAQSENGPTDASPGPPPSGISPRVQAARCKFQAPAEQDQNGVGALSPPSRDLSPTNRDSFSARQQARHTVTQVLSRFTCPPAGGLRPGPPYPPAPEGAPGPAPGPAPARLGPQVGLKSPAPGRMIDRGNPPPIPPKKPGLSQTPSPPHPPVPVKAPASAAKPATPQLPPKPALDLPGRGGVCPVPALTATQVGVGLAPERGGPRRPACAECSPSTPPPSPPVSAPPPSTCESDSLLAAASGWRASVAPSPARGGPVPLGDGHAHQIPHAAAQGNVTLLPMLLNPGEGGPAALFSAAQNGHTECVKLLLAAGVSAEAPDKKGFTPLHTAAAHGKSRCVEALAGVAADVDHAAAGGRTALFLACESGDPESVRALLDAGADRTLVTKDGWTTLHAAAAAGHVTSLELLLYHPPPGTDPAPSDAVIAATPRDRRPVLPGALLNHGNRDGWSPAHIAASKGFKNCLEVLCSHSELDIEKRDKCNRTIHDVATDDCKELLENLDSYRVLIRIERGSEEQVCTVDMLEEGLAVGTATVRRTTGWAELSQSLTRTLSAHFLLLSGGGASLGLRADSVSSVLIGDAVWYPGRPLSPSPWELIRKRDSQHLTVRLKGLAEQSLEELAFDSLIPLQLLQNYIRLVEQYRNIIFHGLEGSCQDYIANQISRCIKHKQEAVGVRCDIIRVEVDENLSKEQLVETFINCGFLVPEQQSEAGGVRGVVVLLEGLERARSLSELLGGLCEGLENRGAAYPLPLLHAQDGCDLYRFHEGGFVIGTLSKSRLHGAELLLQQHFRWVQLRWDSEPLSGLLTRHLNRKLVHKLRGRAPPTSDALSRTVAWVCAVWEQLNSCLTRLGAPEALIGPQVFLSCPVVPQQAQAVLKWMSRLWNMVVVPRVEEAISSRVTAKRSPGQRQSPGNKNLGPRQQAVVKAALSILVSKAVLQGCPLQRAEIEEHLSAFQGGSFPLLSLSPDKGGAKKGRDTTGWRKASTSPRKKGSSAPTWRTGGTLREVDRGRTCSCLCALTISSRSCRPCAAAGPSRTSVRSAARPRTPAAPVPQPAAGGAVLPNPSPSSRSRLAPCRPPAAARAAEQGSSVPKPNRRSASGSCTGNCTTHRPRPPRSCP